MTNSAQKTFFLFTALAAMAVISGCGQPKPSQFPDVVPVSLTVLRDGQPLANSSVKLNYEKSINSAVVSGTTDEKGVCKFQTALAEYVTEGAPVGSAKVTMTVDAASAGPPPSSPDEVAAYQAEQRRLQEEARKVLPPCVLSIRDSTLVYDIPAEGGAFTVNLEEYDDVPVFVPPAGGGAGPPNRR